MRVKVMKDAQPMKVSERERVKVRMRVNEK